MEQLSSSIDSLLTLWDIELKIDDLTYKPVNELLAFDVETDGTDQNNLVGVAVYDGKIVHYYTKNCINTCKNYLQVNLLVGHNIKQDVRWLGLKDFYCDTMLMSYVINPTKISHGLKALAKEYLHRDWPTYKEMVGKGKQYKNLDQQPIVTVANYCGADAIATYELYKYFSDRMTEKQVDTLNFEVKISKILNEMEVKGVVIDVNYLRQLGIEFEKELGEIESILKAGLPNLNLRSPKQVKEWLNNQGINAGATNKRTLTDFIDSPVIQKLFRHRELSKLNSTYVKGILKLPTLPVIHTTFNQVSLHSSEDDLRGLRTGRLSSSEPNLHSIPTRTETGDKLRKAFIAPKGKWICAIDYSQIEYRLLAHYTKEPVLVNSFRRNQDVHEETGKMFGVDRKIGKTLNFASIYGAREKKIAYTAGISEDRARELLTLYWRKLPFVKTWMNITKNIAKDKGYIETITGRQIPIEGLRSLDKFDRFSAERKAINYLIQGSAADIIKLAMIEVKKHDLLPCLQVHDELLFYIDKQQDIETIKFYIKYLMENVIRLIVPLVADIGHGDSWWEAKKK